jgi:hypothetical protein
MRAMKSLTNALTNARTCTTVRSRTEGATCDGTKETTTTAAVALPYCLHAVRHGCQRPVCLDCQSCSERSQRHANLGVQAPQRGLQVHVVEAADEARLRRASGEGACSGGRHLPPAANACRTAERAAGLCKRLARSRAATARRALLRATGSVGSRRGDWGNASSKNSRMTSLSTITCKQQRAKARA